MSEALYLGLRTAFGIDDATFRARFDCSVAEAFPKAVLARRPWLVLTEGDWRMNVDGWLLYDRLIQAFL